MYKRQTFTDTGVPPGATVTYSVTAIDTAGHAGPPATVVVTTPDTIPPTAPSNVSAKVTRDGQVHISWVASTDNSRVASYRVLRSGTGIVQGDFTSYIDKTPRPGPGATVTYSVVAFDGVGNASVPGVAPALRAALLRKLLASNLKISRLKTGGGTSVRIKGTVSDAKAVCRVRAAGSAWRPCKAGSSGAFSLRLRVRRAARITLSLRDELGRVTQQTVRVP